MTETPNGRDDDLAIVSGETPPPMRWWERSAAGALGVGLTVVGTYAVFETSNQAGSALLVLVGAVFLLIGVQGTALVKLGSAGSSVELERRRLQRARRIEAQAAEEEDPTIRAAFLDGAAAAEPALIPLVPALEAVRYEREVYDALTRLLPNDATVQSASKVGDRGYDFLIEWGSKSAKVETKHIMGDGRLPVDAIEQLRAAAGGDARLLVITDAYPSDRAAERAAETSVHIVRWAGPLYDRVLNLALNRVLGTPFS